MELMRYSEGGSCRHDAILRYFGDEEETLAGCGRCDVCRALSGAEQECPVEPGEGKSCGAAAEAVMEAFVTSTLSALLLKSAPGCPRNTARCCVRPHGVSGR